MHKSSEPGSTRQAFLPPMPTEFIVTIRGREVPWLGRLVGTVAAPLLRWRLRRALTKHRPPTG